MMKRIAIGLAWGVLLAGCATNYSWRPSVPERMRTVSVPTFRNESNLTEIGSVMTRQVLREFQREGTFAIRPADEAALEIQGIVKDTRLSMYAFNRRSGLTSSGGEFSGTVEISVIDKIEGTVLIDSRPYTAHVNIVASMDHDTAKRDAAGRLADDLARQVVDDVLNLKWQQVEE